MIALPLYLCRSENTAFYHGKYKFKKLNRFIFYFFFTYLITDPKKIISTVNKNSQISDCTLNAKKKVNLLKSFDASSINYIEVGSVWHYIIFNCWKNDTFIMKKMAC